MSETTTTRPVPLVDLSIQHAAVAAEVAEGFERVLSTGAYVLGPDVKKFENEFAEYSGTAHCVGVANGTDAIELALRAIGVGAGDEVIIPANTFVATAGGVMRTGATPVLVDCDPDCLLIDPSLIEARITPKTKAIIPVHLYGQLAPMPEVLAIAEAHGIPVVEDAAQSQGAERDGRRAGTWGAAAGTSFYPGKNLGAYGDAGAVLTNSDEVAEELAVLRNHGGTVKYQHPKLGFNSRIDTIQATVLSAKLKRLDEWNEQRRAAADYYSAALADVAGVKTPTVYPGNVPVWHLYVVEVTERDRVLSELNAGGIGAGIHYPVPVHLHGAYTHLGYVRGDFPIAEAAADRILSLPIYPGITTEQQDRVVAGLIAAIG
ncbi:dTDP-4-amino-4,6-dideoxygalactose transaminase [Frankineae bacterium MT45]|nr:dTDP-4-amino-4,6-dideoxygalactose transaminase [Frankineae bacterium MT45]